MLHHRHTRLAMFAAAAALILSALAMCGQLRADSVTSETPATRVISIQRH